MGFLGVVSEGLDDFRLRLLEERGVGNPREVEPLLPDKGLVAYLRNGPQVIFGSAKALDEKWAAAAAVLADGSSRGASYIDVRMPDRPVAGGLVLGFAPQDQVTGPGAGVGAGAAGAGGAAGSATAAGSAAAGGVSATGASAGATRSYPGASASPNGTAGPGHP